MFVIVISNELVSKAEDHSKKIFTDIFEQLPRKVWVLKDNVEIEIPLEQIAPNDIVVVTIGEIIAIDGLIMTRKSNRKINFALQKIAK
ncbi:MAG TPA: hypothetical protein DCM38_03675 [Gammaproteobacteria bacterium]|nr:hypothetical protein [Gammaproteobacteria bacterium]